VFSFVAVPEIIINDRLVVPEAAIETKAVRSGGPGGQNVNKLATKIQMWIDLAQIRGLEPDELPRIREFLKSRLDADGRLLVMSQETRDQARNRDDCAAKVVDLIRASLVRPKVRRRTKPTYASKQRRVEGKRRQADRLKNRRVSED
jgi:ribosome-associated protein